MYACVCVYVCIHQCHKNILYVCKDVIHATKESNKHILHAIKESDTGKCVLCEDVYRNMTLERRLQRQRANCQSKMPEPLTEEMQIDRAKSQSKCRSDKHMLH